MTSRSTDSSASRRAGKERLTDDDVYDFALRVSYLSYLVTAKAQETTAANDDTKEKDRDRDLPHHSRISGAISNSFNSLGDLFKDPTREGQKSVKFPDKLFKVLDLRMQNIAMGKDAQFNDQYLRRVIAVFWGSLKATEKQSPRDAPSPWRQIKENRKIEELILFFVTTASQTLRKDPTLTGDDWKMELNSQIAHFVLILRECLRNVTHVPPEITSRLELYTVKLTENTAAVSSPKPSLQRNGGSEATIRMSRVGGNIEDMALVVTVGKLFKRSTQELQHDVDALKRFCSEDAAVVDLKTCLKNINSDMPFPGRRDDFESMEAYTLWRTQELAHLSQLILFMLQYNPNLAKSAPSDGTQQPMLQRPNSIRVDPDPDLSSQNGLILGNAAIDDDDIEAGNNFTYIPPNPKKFYKRLLELCVQDDLEAMINLPEDQEVSLGILSSKHLSLINECALRWRVTHSYRVTCFLDVVRYKYERDEVPIECLPEGLHLVEKAMQDLDIHKWPRVDVDYLSTIYGGLFNIFLGTLYEAFEDISKLTMAHIAPYIDILKTVRDSRLIDRYTADIEARLKDLADRVRIQAVHLYTDKNYELTMQSAGQIALPLLLLTDHLEKQARLLDKRFSEPILGQLDLVSLTLESQMPLFLTDLENARIDLLDASRGKTPSVPILDMFALFRRTRTLLSMHEAFCPSSPLHFDIAGFFEPYVLQWLLTTDMQTAQWVHTAITIDKFEPEGPEGHSSSIIDLFENLKSPVDFLLDLKWPDDHQEARFFTSLSKTAAKLIEEYSRRVEDLFMEEMFPRVVQEVQPVKQFGFIEKAKLTIAGEKKVEPFNFTSSSCVKLNNVDAARGLLDQMYAKIDVDKVTQVLATGTPPPPEKQDRQRFLFTVKVVQAEGLTSQDTSTAGKLDTFVTLSDEKGTRLAKTRTVYETVNPRWDETFDVSVQSPLWLMSSVRDRVLIGKHDTIGRGYLCLDPKRFGDYLTHDLWLDLDPGGRILLRVSMEGEKDDAQFYFGRAFRSLKRAEGDMIRVIIDKMGSTIRLYLSRSVLAALVKTSTIGYDYNKALAGMTGLYRNAIGADKADSVIPLPAKDKPNRRPEQLSDEQIEDAIAPLFDYFDANFQTLNSSLSTTTRQTVMNKVWKEVMATLEALLVPPMSDAPSDMSPLSEKEVDIVFKWLKFLKDYTYANGEGPVPLEQLQNQRYRDLLSIRLYYDWHTDDLMEECVRLLQHTLKEEPTVKKRAKSVYSQRNLGTIKERKRVKKQETQQGNSEMILRILRMRPGTKEFIAQQFAVASSASTQQEGRSRTSRAQDASLIPPVPPVPNFNR
ncbi:hypothetical protein FRB96_008601 [Tulasnella sp. 330]|nr:hypothetical protein FRB96_008601 [Tulasnella sp. 330]